MLRVSRDAAAEVSKKRPREVESANALVTSIKKSLKECGASVSLKTVRVNAEKDLGISLADRKDEIKQIVFDHMKAAEDDGAGAGAAHGDGGAGAALALTAASTAAELKARVSVIDLPLPIGPPSRPSRRLRVFLPEISFWAMDLNIEAPSMWVVTPKSWYRVGSLRHDIAAAVYYKRCMATSLRKFEASATVARVLVTGLYRNKSLSYKTVVDDVMLVTTSTGRPICESYLVKSWRTIVEQVGGGATRLDVHSFYRRVCARNGRYPPSTAPISSSHPTRSAGASSLSSSGRKGRRTPHARLS